MPPRCSQTVPSFPRWSRAPQVPVSVRACPWQRSWQCEGRGWVQGAVGRGLEERGRGLTSPPGSPRWLSCSGPRLCTESGRSPRVCSAEVRFPPRTGSPGGGGRVSVLREPLPSMFPETTAPGPTPTLNGARCHLQAARRSLNTIPLPPPHNLCTYCSLCLCLVNSSTKSRVQQRTRAQ